MEDGILKVLAVEDPAVLAYTDADSDLLRGFLAEVQFDVIPWASYYQTMMDVFEGKAEYDVIMIAGHLWMGDFIEKGYLEKLELEKEDILPVIVREMEYKGKAYLSPSFCDGHMIVYRKSMVKQVLARELPQIMDPLEYLEIAKKITEKTGSPALAMKADASEIFTDALPFLRMYGKDVYDKESFEAVCDSKEVIQGLETYCELKKYAVPGTDKFGNAEIADAIRHKRVAIATTWSGQLGVVFDEACEEKEDLGFATFRTAWNVTWSFGISTKSKKKELAKELLKYLRSERIDRLAGEFSGAPVREKSYLEGKEKYPWYESQMKMIEMAEPLPKMKLSGEKNAVLYQEIAEAFAEKKTAKQAMEDAKRSIDAIKSE